MERKFPPPMQYAMRTRSLVNHSLKSICEVYYTSSKVFLLGVLYSNFTHHNIIFQESMVVFLYCQPSKPIQPSKPSKPKKRVSLLSAR